MGALRTVTVVVAMGTLGMAASSPESARKSMVGTVRSRRGPRYWRGFALWRRALNGFNEKDVDPKENERDVTGAVAEFQEAIAKDPEFADAKSAARITYFDIAKDYFRWKADVSTDGGKTWKADQIRIDVQRAP